MDNSLVVKILDNENLIGLIKRSDIDIPGIKNVTSLKECPDFKVDKIIKAIVNNIEALDGGYRHK